MTLAETQWAFSNWLSTGDGDVSPLIEPGAQRGLAVYSHAYRATLIATLRDTFEKTHAWLGDDGFDAAAIAHIAAHRPSSWTLADYGIAFADTLAGLHPDDPEVAELAWLDWALRRAFDGPDAGAFDAAALAEVDWDAAVLELVPTATRQAICSNAPAIWSAIAAGETPPAAQKLGSKAMLLVWRDALNPRFRTVDEVEMVALDHVFAGASFTRVCEAIGQADPSLPADERAGALLGQWLGDGLVCRVIG